MSRAPSDRLTVQGGYCQYPDTVGCALSAAECDDPSNFLSPRQLKSGPTNAHGGACRWQSTIKKNKLGKCVQEDGSTTECASTIDACPRWDGMKGSFTGDVDQKGWILDPTCKVETTYFPQCDDTSCAWTHEFCEEGNSFEPFNKQCTCDRVLVGACVGNDDNGELETFCAVSEDACDNTQDFLMPREVKGVAGLDCYLCREERWDGSIGSSTVESTTQDSELGLISGLVDESQATNLVQDTNPANNSGQTTIIVVATLGAVAVLAIVGFVTWRILHAKKVVARATESVAAVAPPTAIDIKPVKPDDATDAAETGVTGVCVVNDDDDDSVLSDTMKNGAE